MSASRKFLLLACALAACGKSTSKPTPTPTAAWTDGRCRDDLSASRSDWHGDERDSITVACHDGVAFVFTETRGRFGLVATPTMHDLTREAWESFWKELDGAGWRSVDAPSYEKAKLEIRITDGVLTKKLGWDPAKLSAHQRDISAAFELALGAAPAPAAKEAAAASAITADGRCRDGWRATVTEWSGMAAFTVTLECKRGMAVVTGDTMSGHIEEGDEEMPVVTHPLTRDAWAAMWKQLESARWRELAVACPEEANLSDHADVELEITDGTVTKKVRCEAVSAQLGEIVDVIDKVYQSANDEPAT